MWKINKIDGIYFLVCGRGHKNYYSKDTKDFTQCWTTIGNLKCPHDPIPEHLRIQYKLLCGN